MKLQRFGEFKLVELIKRRIACKGNDGCPVLVGPGDDTFVAGVTRGKLIAGTCDVLVENIHFSTQWASPEEIGYKSITVNLSDLAAMGWCEPKYALIGLALTKNTSVKFVNELYRGMQKASNKYGLLIVGGDTVSSKHDIMISVSLIGELEKKYLLTRSGAKAGDIVAVSGTFGDSAAGLHILKNKLNRNGSAARLLLKKHLLPEPRLALAKLLAQSGAVTGMIDSSDGLAASVNFITKESGAGAEIQTEQIPLSNAMRSAVKNKEEVLQMALHGGEEYELVFTLKPEKAAGMFKTIGGITPIGRVISGNKVTYFKNNKVIDINKTGYEHFK